MRPAVSGLKVSISETQLTAGETISVDVELFTTVKHLLLLHLTLNAKYDQKHENSTNLSSKGEDSNSCTDGSAGMKDNLHNEKTTNINKSENPARKISHYKNCSAHGSNSSNHGNKTYDQHVWRYHSNIYLHTCHLHLHLYCPLPATAGDYHLVASVFSTTDPSSVLLSTVLPHDLRLYERIHVLRPLGRWMSIVPTQADFSLDVVSHTRSMDSRVVWTFSLVNAVVVNRTSEEWNINVSLPKAGCYNVTIKVFNPISCTSFRTHILVQDPVGKLVLNTPSVITTNQKLALCFSIAAGSNVTVSLLVNTTILYRNCSYAKREEAVVVLLFNHTGTAAVELQAENRVSSQNKSMRVCVEGNRKPSPQVKVNPNWQPPTRAFLNLADTGKEVFLTDTH